MHWYELDIEDNNNIDNDDDKDNNCMMTQKTWYFFCFVNAIFNQCNNNKDQYFNTSHTRSEFKQHKNTLLPHTYPTLNREKEIIVALYSILRVLLYMCWIIVITSTKLYVECQYPILNTFPLYLYSLLFLSFPVVTCICSIY